MAFELPAHLPRKAQTQDPSISVLNQIANEPWESFNSIRAEQWIKELDEAILDTKNRILETLINSREQYEEQLDTARSLQTRTQEAADQVDQLTSSVHDERSGLVARLVEMLTAHSSLAQESLSTRVAHDSLSFLHSSSKEYDALAALVSRGMILEAVSQCNALKHSLLDPPKALGSSSALVAIQKRIRIISDRMQEQLSLAYHRALEVSSSPDGASIIVNESVMFDNAREPMALSALLSTLSPSAVDEHLAYLKKQVTTHFIQAIALNPYDYNTNISQSARGSHTLMLTKNSDKGQLSLALQNLQTLFEFLNAHVFAILPTAPKDLSSPFRKSLYKPSADSCISQILTPRLPSSLQDVPDFLDVLNTSVQLEAFLAEIGVRGLATGDIKIWSDNLEEKYERKQAEQLLERAREICRGDSSVTVRMEHEIENVDDSGQPDQEWGFDEEDSWGNLDDNSEGEHQSEETENGREDKSVSEDEEDDGDGWDWNEDKEEDPWDDPPPSKAAPKPKVATRLEKLSAKKDGKAPTSSHSQAEPPPQQHQPNIQPPISQEQQPQGGPPRRRKTIPEKEMYSVSSRTVSILKHVHEVMRRADEFVESDAFARHGKRVERGKLLYQAAPATCDLYRAIYHVAPHQDKARLSSSEKIQHSCDMMYLEAGFRNIFEERFRNGVPIAFKKDKWEATAKGLDLARRKSSDDALDREIENSFRALDRTRGFRDMSDDTRLREAEKSAMEVLRILRGVSSAWQTILPPTECSSLFGTVVDIVLARVVDEIVALPDITEKESERLADICKMLEPLQHLFLDSEGESMIGRFVPSWFRFSYLGELLVGSIADITYLFDEGMLVDYDVGEIVRLLRALFAETPLRENTIRKIERGHPQLTQ